MYQVYVGCVSGVVRRRNGVFWKSAHDVSFFLLWMVMYCSPMPASKEVAQKAIGLF